MKRRVLVSLSLLLLLWLGYTAFGIVAFGRQTATENADAAIVLGAAINSKGPTPVFRERIRHAITLYQAGRVGKLVLTGGIGEGMGQAESDSARQYAIGQGVPADDIYIETVSHTTLGNLEEARRVMQEHHLSSALIVSDPLHMKRAMRMAEDLGLAVHSSPTPTTMFQSASAQLPFLLHEMYFLQHYLLFGE